VRELQGVLQRAVLLARGDSIVTADLDLPGNEMAGNPAEAAAGQPFENSLKSAKEMVVRQFELSYLPTTT